MAQASAESVTVQLPNWIWAYAANAWQDRLFAESNFTPLQQVRATATAPALPSLRLDSNDIMKCPLASQCGNHCSSQLYQ